jgi:PAT family beta-lactamase induction signal transducer AmpG
MTTANRDLLPVLFSHRMLITLLMGFVSGLPLLLTGSVLQAWMQESGVDLGTIGLFALVGLPYTLKFLWAPLLDRYLILPLGRRRGWLLLAQLGIIAALLGLASADPGSSSLLVALAALLVTFFSATQDIAIDAYRREALSDNELGLGASLYVNGYRLGMLLASGGGLILAEYWSFPQVYRFMAAVMLLGLATTWLASEPEQPHGHPSSLREAVWDPLREYFNRHHALQILLLILLYKVGDTMASHMTTPFYLELGFSKAEIGAIVKLFGFWATIAGGFLGGLLIVRLGIYRALWQFGILQGLSTAGFSLLALIGPQSWALASVVAVENLTAGMGTAAYVAFMAALTDKRFTATQYALLSSLMGIPRVILAAPTGYIAATLDWFGFFLLCALLAVPGLLLLRRLAGQDALLPVEPTRHA